MSSIISGFLILLKIAMAVNEGFHLMLTSIYIIIDNIQSSDHGIKPVQETDSAPVVHSSKSRILEAFNRRRANLPIVKQTEEYVSNMKPYKEINITNKDYDVKRKKSSSFTKKSQSKNVENPLNPLDAQGDGEICPSCPRNSQYSTPSQVSLDAGNESEYQSCKTLNGSVKLKKNIVTFCVGDEPGNKSTMLDTSIVDENTSKLFCQNLQRAVSNAKHPSTKNVYNLTDTESTDYKESASAEICTSSSSGLPACMKQLLEETSRLNEDSLNNYCHQNKATNIGSNKIGLKKEACISGKNKPTMEKSSFARRNSLPTCYPAATPWPVNESQESQQNHLPIIATSDYFSGQTDTDSPEDGYLSDSKQVSKRPATKRINTYDFPLSLQKTRWIEMDDFGKSKIEDSKKLYQNADLLKRNALIAREQTDVDQSLVDDESWEDISSSEDDNNVSGDALEECRLPKKRNLSRPSFNLNKFDFSDELDIDSLGRVVSLIRVLQDVGATEVLEDSNVEGHPPQKSMLNILSEIESSYPEKCAEELKIISSPMQTDLLDIDRIPLKELDTKEKQITNSDKLTENYTKRIEAQTEPSKTSTEDTNLDGESYSYIVTTSNEILNCDFWNSRSNERSTVEQGEPEMKQCLRKENCVNEDASKIPEEQIEINNFPEQYLNSTDNNMEETILLNITKEFFQQRFLDIKSKPNSSSGNEENCFRIGRSSPNSNMKDLIKREELETVQIYDSLQVCDKVENASNSGDLPGDDSNHNLGS